MQKPARDPGHVQERVRPSGAITPGLAWSEGGRLSMSVSAFIIASATLWAAEPPATHHPYPCHWQPVLQAFQLGKAGAAGCLDRADRCLEVSCGEESGLNLSSVCSFRETRGPRHCGVMEGEGWHGTACLTVGCSGGMGNRSEPGGHGTMTARETSTPQLEGAWEMSAGCSPGEVSSTRQACKECTKPWQHWNQCKDKSRHLVGPMQGWAKGIL